jgi:hypothetical protein
MPADFDFDLPFKVISFTLEVIQGGYQISEPSNSAQFTAVQRKIMTEAKVGSTIYISDIKAKAEGIDDVRDLPNIKYKIGG